MRSGRARRACGAAPGPWRQRAMRPWSPLRSTSGTSQPRNSAGRVYCGYSSSPSPKLSVTGLTALPITPGTQPGRRPRSPGTRPPRRRPARSRRRTARRRRGARGRGGRRPRSARTAGRTRPPSASSAASAWSKRRPPGPSRNSGRGGSTASTAAKIGSGRITIPAPPPNGLSSTVRWTSVVWSRRSWRAGRAARRSGPCRAGWPSRTRRRGRGRWLKTSIRTCRAVGISQVEQAVGRVDDDHAVGGLRGDEDHRDERAGVELEQVAGRVGDHRDARAPRRVPSTSTTRERRSARGPTARRGRRAARRRRRRW